MGWLFKCCKSNYIEVNVKLVLFYDWFFFIKMDNIMNIEFGILFMVYFILKYVDMINFFLEFLFLLVENYDLICCDIILKGFIVFIDIFVGKGVVWLLEFFLVCYLLLFFFCEKLNVYFFFYCKLDFGEGLR